MDPVCKLYFDASLKLRLKPIKLPEILGFKIELNGLNYYFRGGQTPFNDCVSSGLSLNKFSVNRLLEKANVPTPKSVALTRDQFESNLLDLKDVNYPLVIKPTWDSCCGQGVLCNIKTRQELEFHLSLAFKKYECMSIEEYKSNLQSYRILVLNQKAIGLVHRTPAHVVGDGRHTITELMAVLNKKRKRLKMNHEIPLGPLKIMDETKIIFKDLGINEEYIPWQGEVVPLRYICNSTYGGSLVALPIEKLHPLNARLACKAAHVLNLNLVGFDVICKDISEPIESTNGYFLEANYNPDITIHENATHGVQTRVAQQIVKALLDQPVPKCYRKGALKWFSWSPMPVFAGVLFLVAGFVGFYLYGG